MPDHPRSRYLFSVIRDRLRGHAGPVLDFALGRHLESTPPDMLALVREHPDWSFARATPDDVASFASAASAMLARVYDVSCAADSILPVPGGRAAMAAVVSALLRPGDAVVVTEPGYPAFARLAQQAGARIRTVALDPARGFGPRVEPTGESFEPARLLALNYPNNPTGSIASSPALESFARLAAPDATWFNDAAYAPLTFEGRPFSLLGRLGSATIELHSMGKLFPLGPLASAFLAGDVETIGMIRDYSEFAWAPPSALLLRVGRLCLDDRERFGRLRDEMRARLDRLREVVRRLGFDPLPTAGGIYLLCRAPSTVGGRAVGSAREAADELLATHGLATVPFEVSPDRYVRFSALYRDSDLDGLAVLAREGPLVA